jgi:alpha-galactosidase
MKGLADYVHNLGLRIGTYSSPGPQTCAGFTGSYQHELKDAQQYANWGFDYLKHDWCSYGNIDNGSTLDGLKMPYIVMAEALRRVDRDIVLSLCQYGMGDVHQWGESVGGQLWRTTGDITDTWGSMSGIGFDHDRRSPYAKPGAWNDPDMLVVGYVGWGNPHPTKLTGNEQITHITLWSMLAAPLLIGCDLTKLDDFTKDLLMNHEVIEIDQDPLGKAARRTWKEGDLEVWTRPLFDGSTAVAFFNRGSERATIAVPRSRTGARGRTVRNAWLRKDVGTLGDSPAAVLSASVPAHGAQLFVIR